MVDHTVMHFEIPADNMEKLRKFYTELFGWKIEKEFFLFLKWFGLSISSPRAILNHSR
jgi:predicted enzyme related to lactoylglutathione lyase